MGAKTSKADMLRFQWLWINVVLPTRVSTGAICCNLIAANDYIIPSPNKGIVDTRLAMSLLLGTYTQIAPRLGLATKRFSDIGVINPNYWGEIKVVLLITLLKTLRSRQVIGSPR